MHYISTNILPIQCQSNANPMPMQVDNCTLIFLEQVYRGKLLVSTEDDFTPIPITDLLQSWTISASPLPIHLSTTILPIHQCNVNPEHILPSSSNSPSTTKQTNQNWIGTRARCQSNAQPIHLDKRSHTLAIHQSNPNPSPIHYIHYKSTAANQTPI